MPVSKRELIMQAVEKALKQITFDNGYETTIKQVSRMVESGFELNIFPSIIIMDQGEDKEEGNPANFTSSNLHLDILFWNEPDLKMSEQAIKIASSIEKALGVDQNLGGLAIDTDIVSNRFILEEEHWPIGGGTVTVNIKYRHFRGDPYSG